MSHRWLPVFLLAAACAAPERIGRLQSPGLLSTPARPQAGYFELPPGLEQPPTSVVIPPLDVTVRAPQRWALSNGLEVYAVEDHRAPAVELMLMLPVGTLDEAAGQAGLAALALEALVTGGTTALAPEALDELLDFHAAELSAAAGEEFSGVSLTVRSQDLAALLGVLGSVLRTPRFDEARLRTARELLLEGIRRRGDRPEGLASRAMAKAIYGAETPLGREAQEATLRALTAADVRAFHALLGPKGARLAVAGDFDRGALEALVQRTFGGWVGGGAPARALGTPPPLTRRVIVVPRATAQAHVRIGGWGVVRGDRDEYPARLAVTALAAFGIGRLPRVVRDERGLAYSASAVLIPGPTTGHFVVSLDTKPEQAAQALSAALGVVEAAGRGAPLSAAELTTALDASLNSFAFRFDGAAKIASERATIDAYGLGADYLERYRERLAQVSLAEANALAARLGRPEQLQIVVVGPVDKLGDLSAFGPVVTIADVDHFR